MLSTEFRCFLRIDLIQEVLPIERIALGWAEAGIPDDAAQLFFGGAVGHARGADYVFFEHDRADVIAAETF